MPPSTSRDPARRRLLLLVAILFFSYLCIAIGLPVVPVFVTGQLGFNAAWAGLSAGVAFFATIATRGYAGAVSDRRGAKTSLARGLLFYLVGALFSLTAGLPGFSPSLALAILLVGRLILGAGESLLAVGVIAWGIGLVGPARAGMVMAWVGAAIYGGMALGGPVGLLLYDRIGFSGVMAVSAVLPGLGLAAIARFPGVPAQAHADRPPFRSVLAQIWRHGAVVCLQGVGFAAIGAFFALYFLARHWAYAGLGLTAFGAGFVLVRLVIGGLPDRIGGLPVAIGSLVVETLGQALIASAPDPGFAFAGAFLTGLGCSMVFPAMGREAVAIVAPQLRGAAVGAFAAFQDLAYGLTGPLAGLLADRAGYPPVFALGAVAAAAALGLALWLRRRVAG